ncbi:MAG: NFACT family protein [Deltaproteobacteria bacterium]|nr:NFACT family protein [Deltaproteobacteria bacterium]
MDPGLIKNIAAELDERLRHGIVSKVCQPDERNVILRVFVKGSTVNLLISTHPALPRIHITGREFRNPPAPLRFCAFLRSRTLNSRIEEIRQAEGERIVYIELSRKRDEADESRDRLTLIAELTGKSGNIILTGSDGVVLDALKYYDAASPRPVSPGVRLTPLKTALPPAGVLPPKRDDESWNEAADGFYSALLDKEELASEKNYLRRAITEAQKKAARKLANLNGDREKARAEIDYYRIGELLTYNIGGIKRGQREVRAVDYSKVPPEEVSVRLDERLGPRENIEKYFKRAKKAKTALALLSGRIPEVERELEYIAGLAYEWEQADAKDDLLDLETELASTGYLKVKAAQREKVEERAEPVRRFKSSEGFEILCGKSGLGNDLIVKEYAKDDDIWLHASKVPGSHVLIKAAGRGKGITEQTIKEAASIAAFYSKARGSGKAEVVYTEARNVKRPRGAKPGMVTIKEYRTIMAEPKAWTESTRR